jgi:hypothetical protein
MVTNRLPPDDVPPEGPMKMNDALRKAAAQTLIDKGRDCMAAMSRASVLFLTALREMGGAEVMAQELRDLGLDLGPGPFGPVESLGKQFKEYAERCIKAGLVRPDDPVFFGVNMTG